LELKFLKESNILGNFVLDEDSKPFDDPDYVSFVRKTLKPVDLIKPKPID